MASDRLKELRGLHQPPSDAGTLVVDLTIALALGFLVAFVIVQVVNALSTRRASPQKIALQQLEAVEAKLDGEGLAARARLLQDLAGSLPDTEGDWLSRVDRHLGGLFSQGSGKGLRDALYRRGHAFDLGRFDADLKASLRRAEP